MVAFWNFPRFDNLPEHWYWSGNADDLDCYTLIDQLDPQNVPRFSFDCGHDDHLLDSNRRYHEFLEVRGIPHTYYEHSGGHNWDYWDKHIEQALSQHTHELKHLQNHT